MYQANIGKARCQSRLLLSPDLLAERCREIMATVFKIRPVRSGLSSDKGRDPLLRLVGTRSHKS